MKTGIDFDERMMGEALRLARKGEGNVSPNPMVGAVVVHGGQVVGRGYHRKAGEPHAEVVALQQAGKLARNATIYVNLEPCCHQGKTPPCTEAIIQAGITRVVAAMQDPNPIVNGAGFRRLRSAGLALDKGCLGERARELNETFVTYITKARPFLIAKVAMSLDGKMATATGESKWITSPIARHFSYKLRRSADGILIGVNTVLADDPELARRPSRVAPGRPFSRIVLDTGLRTPPWARILATAKSSPVLIFAGDSPSPKRQRALEARGATVIRCRERDGRVDLAEVCRELGRRSVSSVVVEGGAEVLGAAFDLHLIDKVVFFVAPKIIGGTHALSPVAGRGAQSISDAIPITGARWVRAGSDIVVVGRPDYFKNANRDK